MDLAACCTKGASKCRPLTLTCDDKLRKEVWRLRLNWLYTALVSVLLPTSYTAVSTSFHQFVTNPRSNHLNETSLREFEFGLGQSESFYSWLLATFSIGSFVGATLSGLLVMYFPYSYLYLVSLLAHIVGYTLCATTYEDWLIMIAIFLSGCFAGAEIALAYSYASESSVEYIELMRKSKKKVEADTLSRVRSYRFALQSVAYLVGSLISTSAAVVFAQFEINQFHSLAWFNVANGIALLIVQIILFHGESNCRKITRCRDICHCNRRPLGGEISPLQILILLSLVLLRLVSSIKYSVYITLVNPILSDTFGLTERDTSYVFLGASLIQLPGLMLLFILQKLRANSRIATIIGILLTVSGCALIADWQAIPYDPCTEYSPFHHPEITQNYSIEQQHNDTLLHYTTKRHLQTELIRTTLLTEIHLHSSIEMKFTDESTVKIKIPVDMKLTCQPVDECECNQHSTLMTKLSIKCLFYNTLHNGGNNMRYIESTLSTEHKHPPEHFLCSTPSQSPLATCIHLYGTDYDSSIHNRTKSGKEVLQTSETAGNIQSLQVLSNFSYYIAKMNCIRANVTNRQCHWTPSSVLTKKECEDCQPICRSREQSLTFAQLVLGIILLLGSIDTLSVHIAVMATNHVSMRYQSVIVGALTVASSIGWICSSLFLDASYEAVQRRTFLPMSIMIGLHLPFLIELLVLYRKLAPKTDSPSGYSRIDEPKNCDDSDPEQWNDTETRDNEKDEH